MADLENNENLDPLCHRHTTCSVQTQDVQGVEDDKVFISRITYSEEDRIKIANTEDLHKILADILCKENKIDQEKEHLRFAHWKWVYWF